MSSVESIESARASRPASAVTAPGPSFRSDVRAFALRIAPALALALLAFAFLGTRGLYEPDEGRYVAIALEMERLDDFLIPHLHHEMEHLAKPPLTYWAIAGSLRVFGRNEWAARAPNALAFLAAMALVAGLSRRLSPGVGRLPAWIYATSLMPFVAASVVTTDTLLTLWETLAVFGFVELWWGATERRGRYRVLMWLGFGLAFLTKGPPGLLPLLAIGSFAAWQRGRRGLGLLISWAGLPVFVVVGLSWYVLVVLREPEALGYFLGYEVLDRMVSDVHARNAEWYGAFEVYLPAFLVGSLPWTFVLLGSIRRGVRAGREGGWRELAGRDPRATFLVLWILLPLAVFAVARSRLELYVLPLFVPLVLLVARRLSDTGWSARSWRLRLAAWALLLVAIRGVAGYTPHRKDSREMAQALERCAQQPIDEVVFVETVPRYGLDFYLDAEVEGVTIYPGPHDIPSFASWETLGQELEDADGMRIFALAHLHGEAFGNASRALGWTPRPIGSWRGLDFFRLEENAPAVRVDG